MEYNKEDSHIIFNEYEGYYEYLSHNDRLLSKEKVNLRDYKNFVSINFD